MAVGFFIPSIVLTLFLALSNTAASAQSVLDRVVQRDELDEAVVITAINGTGIGMLAKAAGVPMGFESAPAAPTVPLDVMATNRPLRDVLNELVALDPRYEWREAQGVIVIRPALAWDDPTNVLSTTVDGFALDEVVASDALGAMAELRGVNETSASRVNDTKRFSIKVPDGSSLLDAFNVVVRAHGSLAWAIQPTNVAEEHFPTSVFLFVGRNGSGLGISVDATVRRNLFSRGWKSPRRLSDTKQTNILDRVVGPRRGGGALVVHGFSLYYVQQLAETAHVPMGLETLIDSTPFVSAPGGAGLTLTGRTLREALDALNAIDRRYEWREMGGVVVFRPSGAWLNSQGPLFRRVENVRLDNVTTAQAVGALLSALDRPDGSRNFIADTRRVSVHMDSGTAFDLLNAIARSHGQMSWLCEELNPDDVSPFDGQRYHWHITFFLFGGNGMGFSIP